MSRFEWLEVPSEKEQKKHKLAKTDKLLDEEHYFKLASNHYDEGLFELALRYYSRVLDLDHKVEKAWLGQVLCLIELGEFQEAITWAQKALEILSDSPDVTATLALAWGRMGNLNKAKAFSDASLKTGKQSSLVWRVRGDVLLSENTQNADFCFRKALELSKDDWRLFLNIGNSFLSIKNALKAKEYFVRARSLNPDNPLPWFWLGIAYLDLCLYSEAEQALQKAVDLKPSNNSFQEALRELRATKTTSKLIKKIIRFFK